MTEGTAAHLDSFEILHYEKQSSPYPLGTWFEQDETVFKKVYKTLLSKMYNFMPILCFGMYCIFEQICKILWFLKVNFMQYLAKPSNDIQPICLIVDEGSYFYKRQFIVMVEKKCICISCFVFHI